MTTETRLGSFSGERVNSTQSGGGVSNSSMEVADIKRPKGMVSGERVVSAQPKHW